MGPWVGGGGGRGRGGRGGGGAGAAGAVAEAAADEAAAKAKAEARITMAIDVGYFVLEDLGANMQEIVQRWGPYKNLEDKHVSFDGLEVWYQDAWDNSFILTRKGAGMGSIFVGVNWCNKDYIEKVFGKVIRIEKSEDDGVERWSLDNAPPDGWYFSINLTFDKNGLVREFSFQGESVNLD
ncbi:hypothetical protein R80B4_03131 [Fibrobacteres bacterium R8-0-B4]